MGKSTKRQLNDRQRAFVEHYLTCWNASEAARRAGYKNRANSAGSEIMANPAIRAAIDARLEKMAMGANEVLARLAGHARGDLSPFLVQDVDEVTFDLSTEQAKQNLHLIKKIKSRTRRGTRDNGEEWEEHDTEIELHDAQTALVQIGRYHKLFVDRVENETPIVLIVDK